MSEECVSADVPPPDPGLESSSQTGPAPMIPEITREERIQAFAEWMRSYIESPHEFTREWESVVLALEDGGATYGASCNAYLEHLVAERRARQAVAFDALEALDDPSCAPSE